MNTQSKTRYAMVGGDEGAFIGAGAPDGRGVR